MFVLGSLSLLVELVLSLEIDLPRNQPVEIGPGLLVKGDTVGGEGGSEGVAFAGFDVLDGVAVFARVA